MTGTSLVKRSRSAASASMSTSFSTIGSRCSYVAARIDAFALSHKKHGRRVYSVTSTIT